MYITDNTSPTGAQSKKLSARINWTVRALNTKHRLSAGKKL
jgi:hypothetical protein